MLIALWWRKTEEKKEKMGAKNNGGTCRKIHVAMETIVKYFFIGVRNHLKYF